MQRRHVLTAVAAAISTPADAWLAAAKGKSASEGDTEQHFTEVRPFLGLNEAEQKVKRFLSDQVQEYIGRLVQTPGHAPIADLWVLCEALLVYSAGDYNDQPGGLLSAIEDVTRSDRRFIVVPEEIHEEVATAIEFLKEHADKDCHLAVHGNDADFETQKDFEIKPWKDAPAEA